MYAKIVTNNGFHELSIKKDTISIFLTIGKGLYFVSTNGWISNEIFPKFNQEVEVIVDGKFKNCIFRKAILRAIYCKNKGWIIVKYPDWKDCKIHSWRPIKDNFYEHRKYKNNLVLENKNMLYYKLKNERSNT